MVSYDGLRQKLTQRGLKKGDLVSSLGLSSKTVAKIAKGERLADRTIRKIAVFLSCPPEELYRIVSENAILQKLRDEKEARIAGGLYHELQIEMAYNSNHIEGSLLSEEETRMIFETSTIGPSGTMPVDDIVETVNHFRALDYVIDHAEEELTEEMIKHLHYLLKSNTVSASLPWFALGDYKKQPNTVGGKRTARPSEVPKKMKRLLEDYQAIPDRTIEDIIAFHAAFEKIHPFQDGNGRVGRLIAFKECLHYDIVPFLILDRKKRFYYRGLSEWDRERGYLLDTCLDGQDTFRRLLDTYMK